jgi:hypothetical protein
MSAKWRRCQVCRKVLSAEDFEGDSQICRTDEAKAAAPASAPARRSASVVTTRVVTQAQPAQQGVMAGLRGRGDTEVRARRARMRALERLAEQFAEDFELILREERIAEGL